MIGAGPGCAVAAILAGFMARNNAVMAMEIWERSGYGIDGRSKHTVILVALMWLQAVIAGVVALCLGAVALGELWIMFS